MHFNPISFLPLLALASAVPTSLTARQYPVETTYLAIVPGGSCSAGGPTYVAGNFTISSPYCTTASVSEYLIAQLPGVDCKGTIYNSYDCIPGTERTVTDIPAGSGNVCIFGSIMGAGPNYPPISLSYTCA